MNAPLRPLGYLHLAGFLTVVIVGFATAWGLGSWLAVSPRDWSELQTRMVQEQRRSRELAAKQTVVFRPIEAKLAIAEEVIAGRLTLAEAIALFDALDEAKRVTHPNLWLADLGERRESKTARLVIDYVRYALRGRPDEAATVVERLERKWRHHAGRGQNPLASSTTIPDSTSPR